MAKHEIHEQDPSQVLSPSQIDEFLTKGVLVVDEILSEDELRDARDGLHRTLLSHGIDTNNLAETGQNLQKLSSTNGSGGVLDLFYPDWKLRTASNPRLFRATCELWEASYCHQEESLEELGEDQVWRWHPYGPFDCHKGYMYVDRIGFRIPTRLAEQLGSQNHNNNSKKSKPIQRSLTPHLDCCPENLFTDTSKWRPIQCFVSLTDNLESNTGGFEAVPGFHVEFDAWARNRPPSNVVRKKNGHREEMNMPAPCIGNYTHIRPKEDAKVFARIRHVPVRAGSAVFWDNRIPHGNAYGHSGDEPRAVVYCSFLPDVALNRQYVARQLRSYRSRRQPTDQWINKEERQELPPADEGDCKKMESSSSLFRKLIGIDEW